MLDVIYEDNHLLVVNKPSGMLTQPSGTDKSSLEALAKKWLQEKYRKKGNAFLEAVHRLDKPASGIVLFAKTSKALSRLNAAMRSNQCHKQYAAITEGIPSPSEDDLEHYLVHAHYCAEIANKETPNAKRAQLHYRVIKQQQGLALIRIKLITGRYHQIRAQLSAIGCPILGDTKYGAKKGGKTIALHHHRFEVPHPITQEILHFEASLPKTWPLQHGIKTSEN